MNANPSLVVGIIDNPSGSEAVVYFDDLFIGGPSAWSCDGWGERSCPF